jgi:dTDP-4-amino-4,6-dideoxygalactose transaminase
MNEYSSDINFIDLKSQKDRIRFLLDAAIAKVLDHGQFIMGPEVKELEFELQQFTGAKFALTCANGTDALTLALMALNLKSNDVVFVPSFTYVATAEAPAQLGLIPYMVDVCPTTFNISIDSLKDSIHRARKEGLSCKAVIIVDLFGQPADFQKISEIANEENIKVIIDAAQSFGGSIQGKKVGSMGDITTTSFFPAKPLGCFGDGGAVFTNEEELSSIINSLRLHGKGNEKYDNVRIGLNSRLDTIQAAVLLEKLKIFPDELKKRQWAADSYTKALIDCGLELPVIADGMTSAWAQFTIKTSHREFYKNKLYESGIPTGIYYPKPLHEQSGYNHFPQAKDLDVSKELSTNVLSLPMHPYLQESYFSRLEEILR